MATSETDIANLALRHLAITTVIGTLTENSKEAKACNTFYAQTRDEVLEAFAWPFCTVIDNLALVATAPNVEWGYSYQYPSCLAFRRILSGSRTDSRQSRVVFRIANKAGGGRLLFTDLPNAQGEWTVQVTDVTQFAPAFVQALAFKLASYVGPSVAGNDLGLKLAQVAAQRYEGQLAIARANALNEEQLDLPPDAEGILARDGFLAAPPNIFNIPL